jgi:hypothetical protein
MKLFLGALILLGLSTSINAQNNYSIKGSVADTTVITTLENALVMVMQSKDSTLVSFARTKADGSFSISNLEAGKYFISLSYPKYADFIEQFTLDSLKKSVDFGKINMLLKSKLLEDVIIKGKTSAIKIKGDTTEYNAASFVIEPNSRVEDLLKQLPGIQVDKDGKITAQGQAVTKVLVDGEEFFGDDPTLVTKNIRADMVDKVQAYDKKSDQATFTGIDDGERTKTLNIKLKEDSKKGYFGKIDGGSADGTFYQGQGMINYFQAKRKIAAYSTVANTGKTGLSWEDGSKYGATNNIEFTEDGGMMMYMNRGDDMSYNGQGMPLTQNGGMHFESKWNKDKESINSNYKVGALSLDGVRSNIGQNEVDQILFNSQDQQTFRNYTFRQKLDATYQLKIDSTSNLKVMAEGSFKNTESNTSTNALTSQSNTGEQIKNFTRLSNDGKQQSFNASAFYTKKLRKDGRTYSVRIGQTFNDSEGEGFLNFQNQRLDVNNNPQPPSNTDQLKTMSSVSSAFSSNITYTEPLTKEVSVVVNYGLNLNNSTSNRRSFDMGASGNYDVLNTEFTNNFRLNQLSNEVGAVFNYKKDKQIISVGSKFAGVDFDQIDLDKQIDNKFARNFVNYRPQASYQYNFSRQRSFSIRYNGNTRQPSLNDLQPIRVNDDPLNIVRGNPNLKPSFENQFNAHYYSYKMLTNQYINFFGYYSFNINPIVNESIYQSLITSQRSVNLNDKVTQNFQFGGYLGKKLKSEFHLNVNLNLNGGVYYNYLNNVLNKQDMMNYSGGVQVSRNVAKKHSFGVSLQPSYATYQNSIRSLANNNGAKFNSHNWLTVHLPRKFEISTDANYNYIAKTQLFNESVGYFIWNASLSRKFMKNDALKFTVSGNDLLKENIGFTRNAQGSRFTENRFNRVNRYFLFSLVWDFNKMGGGLQPTK